jgi:SAM-dependent methyltransferase
MAGRIETAAGNADMAAAWDGDEGTHWAEHADRYEMTSMAIGEVLLDALGLGERSAVLDIGCGTGATTRAVARRVPAGTVLGVDLSSPMLAVGRRRAEAAGLANVSFEQADAQVYRFPAAAFDIAISNFGAMFFSDPVAAFTNIRGALRPGGSLALLAWREIERNEWINEIRAALAAGRDLPSPPPGVQGPFSLADQEIATERLAAAGYSGIKFRAVDEPVYLGNDADDAWPFISTSGIAKGLTEDLDEAARAQAFANLRRSLEAHETAAGVRYASSAWLITARNGEPS